MALSTPQIMTLLQLKGLGRISALALGKYAEIAKITLETPRDIFNFLTLGKEKKIARGLKDYSLIDIDKAKDAVAAIYDYSEREGVRFVSFYDGQYPNNLKTLTKNGKNTSPILLYYKGDLSKLSNRNGVAIIGTREPTTEGIETGRIISEEFAKRNFNIISGLAIGCDTCAHKGALNVEGGLTTAFLAHGLDTIYPRQNESLAKEILERGGLLISEYAVGTSLRPEYLVERDRLQSGLANATIVIQTGIKGGTMHAVASTIENRKPLFAVKYKDPLVCLNEKVLGNMNLINNASAYPLTYSEIETAIKIIESRKNNQIKPINKDLFS